MKCKANTGFEMNILIRNLVTVTKSWLQVADSGYQAPVSTGNLYYYYYPVAAYPINEKADEDELDPLVLVLLPVALLVGFLALVSIFSKKI